MSLKEFLLTAHEDDDLALAEAHSHPETRGRLISPDMMLAFLTKFELVHILDTVMENPDTPATNEAKALRWAFKFGSEFNLIDGHPATQIAALDKLKLDKIISAAFCDFCVNFANPNVYPYINATIEEVKSIRHPADVTPCSHGGQDFVVSISGRDLFSFVTTTNAPMTNLHVIMYWRENSTKSWKESQTPILLQGGDKVISQVVARPSGINAARHFRFEYTAPYTGLIDGIAVSVGQ
jgi:hypothetical protein